MTYLLSIYNSQMKKLVFQVSSLTYVELVSMSGTKMTVWTWRVSERNKRNTFACFQKIIGILVLRLKHIRRAPITQNPRKFKSSGKGIKRDPLVGYKLSMSEMQSFT